MSKFSSLYFYSMVRLVHFALFCMMSIAKHGNNGKGKELEKMQKLINPLSIPISEWLSEQGRKVIRQGFIVIQCLNCGKDTWHKPISIPMLRLGTQNLCHGYTRKYLCVQCGNIFLWKYRPLPLDDLKMELLHELERQRRLKI